MFKLRFTNPWGEQFYFCNLGGFWHANDTRRLIERTTSQAAQARRFDTRELAEEVLTVTEAKGWEIVEEVE
jgi:hypothetical protein